MSHPGDVARATTDAVPGSRVSLDRHLLRRMAAGDVTAFGAFYDATCNDVHALVAYIRGDDATTDDIVECVFHSIWQEAHAYASARAEPRDAVLAKARELALTSAGRRPRDVGSRAETLAADAMTQPRVHQPSPAPSSPVRAALDQLPALQHAVVHLAYFDGCASAELSVRLALDVRDARAVLRSALHAIRCGIDSSPSDAANGTPAVGDASS